MEKLSIPSIDVLTEVITGDNKISPYRTWTKLEELFEHFQIKTTQFRKVISIKIGARRGNRQGETAWVNANSERLSRKNFTKGILQTLDLDKIILIINEILDCRYYKQTEYKLDETVEILRDTLKKDKLQIVQIEDTFECQRLNQQGLNDDKRRIQVFNKVESHNAKEQVKSNKVFIVHGHDEEMLNKVKNFFAETDGLKHLQPVVLRERFNGGATIIEKFEREADEACFAIVLYSPDDIGRAKSTNPESERARARQNVVWEHGYFVGKLGRQYVVSIYKDRDSIEIPSDLSGLIVEIYNGDWEKNLIEELKEVGLYKKS